MIGEKLGRYVIKEEVGQGGMSVVYRGLDTVLDRPVAIKVLHPHLSNREESRRRFQREARAIAKLSHPNIMQVFDFSETGAERSYIVMEFLDGCTLREALDRRPLKHPEVAAMIGISLCDALKHAHEFGIIHRDIKPENVMIGRDGVVKLTDFGIAQMVDAQAMTVTGALLGSPAHMCPEMIEGDTLDFRADIFSLGTVLYFAATGELPFMGKNAPLVLKAILEGDYLDAELLNPRVGRRLSRIIDTCLARRPDDRYASVTELREDLQAHLDDVGLGDVDAELAGYFSDPDTYQDALKPRLLAVLEERGATALKERRVAAALEYFNRVLAVEPEHERVLKLIRRIDQRRKLFVYVGALAVLLLATITVVAISDLVMDDAPDPDALAALPAVEAPTVDPTVAFDQALGLVATAIPPAEAAAHTAHSARAGQQAGLNTVETARARATAVPARAAPPSERPVTNNASRHTDADAIPELDAGVAESTGGPPDAGVKAPTTRTVKLTLGLFPPNANVTVAGRPYDRKALAAGVLVEVPTTMKFLNITAEHDRCLPTTRKFRLDGQTEFKSSIQLKWKPALLLVKSNDPGALVLVFDPGSNAQIGKGTVNTPLPVRIDDPQNPVRRVKVTIIRGARSGVPINHPSVDLTAGETSNLPAFFRN